MGLATTQFASTVVGGVVIPAIGLILVGFVGWAGKQLLEILRQNRNQSEAINLIAPTIVELKADVKEVKDKVQKIEVDNARQFGGNGGGMREAINKAIDIAQTNGTTVAELKGVLAQHLAEAEKQVTEMNRRIDEKKA